MVTLAASPNDYRMPTASTEAALSVLINNFASDKGVMFGLFNEPCMASNRPECLVDLERRAARSKKQQLQIHRPPTAD